MDETHDAEILKHSQPRAFELFTNARLDIVGGGISARRNNATRPHMPTRQIARHYPRRCGGASDRGRERRGAFSVKMFLMPDGQIWINEIAPRVHNSGHYTIEAGACSQFENHVRAVLGWPLGSTAMVAPAAAMVNLLGTDKVPGI